MMEKCSSLSEVWHVEKVHGRESEVKNKRTITALQNNKEKGNHLSNTVQKNTDEKKSYLILNMKENVKGWKWSNPQYRQRAKDFWSLETELGDNRLYKPLEQSKKNGKNERGNRRVEELSTDPASEWGIMSKWQKIKKVWVLGGVPEKRDSGWFHYLKIWIVIFGAYFIRRKMSISVRAERWLLSFLLRAERRWRGSDVHFSTLL